MADRPAPFGYASVPMTQQGMAELLSRCREVARQLADIGEEQHAQDVQTLIAAYIDSAAHG